MNDFAMPSNLEQFQENVSVIRETITQTPRGPWRVSLSAGYDRALFVNQAIYDLDHEIDFVAVREQMETFFLSARAAADKLETGLVPLVNFIRLAKGNLYDGLTALITENNTDDQADQLTRAGENLKQADSQLKEVAAALKDYKARLAGYEQGLSKMDAAYEPSANQVEEDLQAYLKTAPAGKDQAIKQYQGFLTQLSQSLSGLKQAFLRQVPDTVTAGEELVGSASQLVAELTEAVKSASDSQDVAQLRAKKALIESLQNV